MSYKRVLVDPFTTWYRRSLLGTAAVAKGYDRFPLHQTSSTLTRMPYIKNGQVVCNPPPSERLPPNPLLGYDGDRPAPPSEAGSTYSKTLSRLTNQVLFYDQRCLVTGTVSTALQAFHLVNAIRSKESDQEGKKSLKKEVVHNPVVLSTHDHGGTSPSRNASSPGNSLGWENSL